MLLHPFFRFYCYIYIKKLIIFTLRRFQNTKSFVTRPGTFEFPRLFQFLNDISASQRIKLYIEEVIRENSSFRNKYLNFSGKSFDIYIYMPCYWAWPHSFLIVFFCIFNP